MPRLVLDDETYAAFAAWAIRLARRRAMMAVWNTRGTAVLRAFGGEDPATFTPGHPDYVENKR